MYVIDISVLKDKKVLRIIQNVTIFFKTARKFLMFLMYGKHVLVFCEKMEVIELTRSYTDLPLPVNCSLYTRTVRNFGDKRDIRSISSSEEYVSNLTRVQVCEGLHHTLQLF
jgi:hypothetical protein